MRISSCLLIDYEIIIPHIEAKLQRPLYGLSYWIYQQIWFRSNHDAVIHTNVIVPLFLSSRKWTLGFDISSVEVANGGQSMPYHIYHKNWSSICTCLMYYICFVRIAFTITHTQFVNNNHICCAEIWKLSKSIDYQPKFSR